MFAAWEWAVHNVIAHRVPDPVDYLEMRRRTVGGQLMVELPLAVQGSLPEALLTSRAMISLTRAVEDHLGLVNDVVSYQKEIQYEGDFHNSVLVAQSFLGIEPEQAMLVVCDLMGSRLRQFEHVLASELPAVVESVGLDDAQQATLDEWIVGMQTLMAGNQEWHLTSRRFDEDTYPDLLVAGAVIHHGPDCAAAREPRERLAALLAHGPSGLGTDGARVASWFGSTMKELR